MIIDGTDLMLGRLASFVARELLLGEKVDIVNCKDIVISGTKQNILKNYKRKREMGNPLHGPYFPRVAKLLVKRTIRGMLPYKKQRGREAFEKLMCYNGVPENFKDKEIITVEEANVKKLPNLKYMKVSEITKELGAKR